MKFKFNLLLAYTTPIKIRLWLAKQLLRSIGLGGGGKTPSKSEEATFAIIKKRDPVVFDAGAHIGGYCEQVMRFFPQAQVHAFEPSRVHFDILKENVAKFNNITANNLGLGNCDEGRTLYKDQNVTGLASLTKRDLNHIGRSFEETEEVEIVTLDNYYSHKKIPHIDLLKLDIEGHELDALHGAIDTIKNGKVHLIQFEFGGTNIDSRITFRDLYSFLRDNDYQINLLTPNGQLLHIPNYDEFWEHYVTTDYLAIAGNELR